MSHLFSKNTVRYILLFVFAGTMLTAAFMLMKTWEDRNSQISVGENDNSTKTYNGKKYVYRKEIETFLVLGLDSYEDEAVAQSHDSGIQTDFLLLLVFDNNAKTVSGIHINRDTMTKVNKLAVGGATIVDSFTKQIALAHNYVNDVNEKIRCRNSKDSVEYLLNGVKVNHYLSFGMDAVPLCVDYIGGVELTIVDDFTGVDADFIKGQTINLTGEQSLRYVRDRGGLADSTNIARMARQRQFMAALYNKLKSGTDKSDDFLVKLVDLVDDYIVYDSSNQKMLEIARRIEDYEFRGITDIKGEAKIGEEDYIEFYPDQTALEKLIIDTFYTAKE